MKGHEKRIILCADIEGNIGLGHREPFYNFKGSTQISAPGIYKVEATADKADPTEGRRLDLTVISVGEDSVTLRYFFKNTVYEEKTVSADEKCIFGFSDKMYTDDGFAYEEKETVCLILCIIETEYEYEGGTSVNGIREGYGECKYDDGSVYKGEWLNNKRNGYGIEQSGSMYYEGYWKDDKKHGKGLMRNDTCTVFYIGDWKDNARDGYGTEYIVSFKSDENIPLHRNSAVCYSGEWKCNLRHGHGVYDTGSFVQQALWEYNKPVKILKYINKAKGARNES